MSSTTPAPFSFDSWLDTGTAAQVVKHRYNDLAAVHAYREAAEMLRTFQTAKAKQVPRGEESITDAAPAVPAGERAITDVVTDEEAELIANAEQAWAKVEASMETWTIRALNSGEIAQIREQYPAPESPTRPTKNAKAPTRAKYKVALEEWADTALTTRLTQDLAVLSAATVSVVTAAGTIVARGLLTDEGYVPAVTIDQLRRIYATPGQEEVITDFIAAAVATTKADVEPTAPFWRAMSENAPG